MDSKKDLGELFKKRLDEVEMAPTDTLWTAISESLDRKKRRRRAFLWFGGLAVLLILLGVSYSLLNDSVSEQDDATPSKLPIVKTDSATKEANEQGIDLKNPNRSNNEATTQVGTEIKTDSTYPSDFKPKRPTEKPNRSADRQEATITSSSEGKTSKNRSTKNQEAKAKQNAKHLDRADEARSAANANSKKEDQDSKKLSKTENTPNQNLLAKNTSMDSNRISASKDSVEVGIVTDSLPTKNDAVQKPKKKLEEKMVKLPKPKLDTSEWLISVQAGPAYYDFLSNGTPFDQSLSSGKTLGKVTLSFGALLNIPLSEKTTFRLGYRQSNFAFVVKDAVTTNSNFGGIFTNSAIDRNGQVVPTAITTAVNTGQPFELEQKMRYNEIPFELYHNLKDGKLKVSAIGGVSAMIMGNSSVTLKTMGERFELGTVNSQKKTAFSLNVGFGLKYQVSDKISLDIEPVIRYQFGTFENGFENLHPVIPTIQTGITLKL